jgi:hypothetical protein
VRVWRRVVLTLLDGLANGGGGTAGWARRDSSAPHAWFGARYGDDSPRPLHLRLSCRLLPPLFLLHRKPT